MNALAAAVIPFEVPKARSEPAVRILIDGLPTGFDTQPAGSIVPLRKIAPVALSAALKAGVVEACEYSPPTWPEAPAEPSGPLCWDGHRWLLARNLHTGQTARILRDDFLDRLMMLTLLAERPWRPRWTNAPSVIEDTGHGGRLKRPARGYLPIGQTLLAADAEEALVSCYAFIKGDQPRSLGSLDLRLASSPHVDPRRWHEGYAAVPLARRPALMHELVAVLSIAPIVLNPSI